MEINCFESKNWIFVQSSNQKRALTLIFFRYNWTCSTSLSYIEKNCFNENTTLTFDMTDPVLTFPVAWLQKGKQYLFVLEVSVEGVGSENATQVIEVADNILQ